MKYTADFIDNLHGKSFPPYHSGLVLESPSAKGLTKIAKLDHGSPITSLGVQQCVLQLDVAIGDVHFVTVIEGKYKLLEKPACLVLVQPSTAYNPQSVTV